MQLAEENWQKSFHGNILTTLFCSSHLLLTLPLAEPNCSQKA